MHVMNSLSLVNEKEGHHGDTPDVGLMPGHPPVTTSISESTPGAPPPPPPPPEGSPAHGLRKKRRVRSFFWKTIPEEKVRGKPNIWTLAARQQQYQIDVRTIEELFGQQEEARSTAARDGHTAGSSRTAFMEPKEEVSILDSKRSMNVGIFLKQLKKSNESIIEDIRLGSSKLYGSEKLKELLKLLPESEEAKKLKAFKGDTSKLTLVDSFMYLLLQVPSFDLRIEAMVLKEEFVPTCSVLNNDIDVIRMATKELMTCEELHAILHLVLQAGNIMNAGGYAGNAVGFKLSSLLKLADTRANKPGMNLLHFVALEAQKKDETLLKFPEKLQHVQSAARISVENIEVELQSLSTRTKSLEENIQHDTELLQQLDEFLQSSEQTLQDLKRHQLELRKEGNALIDFFCEDKETFKLDECFKIFQDFCLKFKKAVKDNLERDLKEAARQRRLRELEEKRHSWAGGERGGGFGRSSSENDVEMLTKEGLLDFLQQRPYSPLARSSSVKRSRHSLAVMADRELRSFLEGSSAEDPTKFNSLPRASSRLARKSTAWMDSQDDNRELGVKSQHLHGKEVTTPCADKESTPQIPAVAFNGNSNINEDPILNSNNNYATVSESLGVNRNGLNKNVFQKTKGISCGQINVSVTKHTLVQGLQAFDLVTPNNNNMHFVNQGDVVVTDLEIDKDASKIPDDAPPSTKSSPSTESDWKMESSQFTASSKKEEEDNSTVSSTTCDTPLPLDNLVSNKRPIFYIVDRTETDCSVTFDYSEICDDSLAFKEGNEYDCQALGPGKENLKDQSSLSLNLESESTNDPSISITHSATTEEGASDSCEAAEEKKDEKTVDVSSSKTGPLKTKPTSKLPATRSSGTGRSVRMLTASESQNLRKVVPISRKTEKLSARESSSSETRHPQRDQSTPVRKLEHTPRTPRRSSLPAEDPKVQKGTPATASIGRAREQTRTPSVKKPSAKPVRNIPKPKPEEKMCRSTMRALAQAQAASAGSAPQTPTHNGKALASTPSFARNTVASSSRRMKKDLAPNSNPTTPSKTATPTRTGSQRQPVSKAVTENTPLTPRDEENTQGTLRRVQSVRVSNRNPHRSETPPPKREQSRKGSSFSEKSVVQSKDLSRISTGKSLKPTWK
uniref:FH2 domain containing 1 n=1 Tax=Lepisosteus oculatus TaxID=7918 RepID=W5MPP8_LEPOC